VGHLELHHHHVARRQVCDQRAYFSLPDLSVAPGRDRDRILAAFLDQDQGRSAGLIRVPGHTGDIDAIHLQIAEQLLTEGVCPDPANHSHVGAKPRRGGGLVRAFASGKAEQPVAQNGFTRSRQDWHTNDQVHVDAAQNGNARHGKTFCRERARLDALPIKDY
jgi:hypothetical protein